MRTRIETFFGLGVTGLLRVGCIKVLPYGNRIRIRANTNPHDQQVENTNAAGRSGKVLFPHKLLTLSPGRNHAHRTQTLVGWSETAKMEKGPGIWRREEEDTSRNPGRIKFSIQITRRPDFTPELKRNGCGCAGATENRERGGHGLGVRPALR